MSRRCFFSFHYKPDCWRASQIRNIGVIEGNKPVTDNDWETVTRGGETAIKKWIDEQLSGRTCTIVLIGENTAGRKWINYEIVKSWESNKGVVGIYIHKLKNENGEQCDKGNNPFDHINYGNTGKKLSSIVKAYDTPYITSDYVYAHIKDNIDSWVEEAIKIRESN